MYKIKWSKEIQFNRSEINELVPEAPGIYQILQSEEYQRYQGKTRILKIGISEKKRSLRYELNNHLNRHTAANRIARIRKRPGINITVICAEVNDSNPKDVEDELLRLFEDEHWELPLLNSQRGYKRDTDKHFRN